MTADRFFIVPEHIKPPFVEISGDEFKHLHKVLRFSVGDSVRVTDGCGREFIVCIDQLYRDHALGTILEQLTNEVESHLRIGLVFNPVRHGEDEGLLRSATELGVNEFYPVAMQHTQIPLSGMKGEARIDRYRKILISAMKQSGRRFLPTLHPAQSLEQFLRDRILSDLAFVLHPSSEGQAELPLRKTTPIASVLLMVGPEGGLAEHEIESARGAGFRLIALGPRILRVHTAILSAIAIIQSIYGDFFVENTKDSR